MSSIFMQVKKQQQKTTTKNNEYFESIPENQVGGGQKIAAQVVPFFFDRGLLMEGGIGLCTPKARLLSPE